jgi:hypothetical protein
LFIADHERLAGMIGIDYRRTAARHG